MSNFFNLKKSNNYFAYRLTKFADSFVGKVFQVFFNLIGLTGLGLLVYLIIDFQLVYLDWAFRLGFIYLGYKIGAIFYQDYLLGPKVDLDRALELVNDQNGEINLADTLDPCLLKAFYQGGYSPKEIALNLIGLEELGFVISRAGIERELVGRLTKEEGKDKDQGAGNRKLVLIKALQVAKAEGHQQVSPGDLFVALALIEPVIKKVIDDLGLTIEDLLNIVYWRSATKKRNDRFLDSSSFIFNGGVGRDWIFGYTRFLNRYSQDITLAIMRNKNNLKYIGHSRVIEQMEKSLLSNRGKNIVLVGPEGSGKRTSVYGLAKRIALGQSYGGLKLKQVLEIDLEAVLAGAVTKGEIINRLNQVFGEAERVGNLILFVDNITNMLSSKGVGQVDISQILIPYLNSGSFSIIGTAQPGQYHRYIEVNSALAGKFEQITVDEPSQDEMIRILEDAVPILESRTGCFFRYLAIKEVLLLANKYIFDQPNPQKSLKLLDKVATENRGQEITIELVRQTASTFLKVPVGEAQTREKKKLLNLEEILHQRIVNQNQAIEEISNAMRRGRAEIGKKGQKPIGSFLFIGPTGVGKTETAKALADSYFGGEEKMVRFDMSEYQNQEDIYRLLGDKEEGGRTGALSETLKQNPYCLLLFDEIEKAHPEILNIFLQILDEGVATATSGDKLVFANTIIIATSNAGSEFIRQKIKQGEDSAVISEEILDYLMEQNQFKPELLNRFTSVISFSPLSRKQIEQIANMKLDKLKRQIKSEKDIDITFGENVPSEIASRGYNPEMGARPMERAIEDTIENLISKKILADDLKRGDQLTITVADFEF